jgi:hypothetical protein
MLVAKLMIFKDNAIVCCGVIAKCFAEESFE